LLLKLLKKKESKKIIFSIILGPLAKNKQKFLNLAKKNKHIECIDGAKNITNHISKANLYIGTSGTSIFETALYNIPSILIKISKNQNTNIFSLEKLGHYFFLEKKDLSDTKKMSKLILLLVKNYTRLKSLVKSSEIKVDDEGSKRVVNTILLNKNFYPKKNSPTQNFSKKLLIDKITDKEINFYLHCRNLEMNIKNSSDSKKIKSLDHYIWWFLNKRNSYVLNRSGKRILYFYDQKTNNKIKDSYTLSGWFACVKDCSIKEILHSLNWQRYHSSKVKWISCIKKCNKFSIKLSKYIGWQLIKKNNEFFKKIKFQLKIKTDNFYFYKRGF